MHQHYSGVASDLRCDTGTSSLSNARDAPLRAIAVNPWAGRLVAVEVLETGSPLFTDPEIVRTPRIMDDDGHLESLIIRGCLAA